MKQYDLYSEKYFSFHFLLGQWVKVREHLDQLKEASSQESIRLKVGVAQDYFVSPVYSPDYLKLIVLEHILVSGMSNLRALLLTFFWTIHIILWGNVGGGKFPCI